LINVYFGRFFIIYEKGEPDRMIPFKEGSNSNFWWKGMISQYTFASLTALAINWVYWLPKSRIRIFSVMVVRRYRNQGTRYKAQGARKAQGTRCKAHCVRRSFSEGGRKGPRFKIEEKEGNGQKFSFMKIVQELENPGNFKEYFFLIGLISIS
jgi:hypothetical protein